MAITSALVLLAVIWFMVFFVVLPLRLRTQGDDGVIVPGTHAGSPTEARIKLRMGITTGVALVLWALACGVILSGWVSVDDVDILSRLGGGRPDHAAPPPYAGGG